MVFIGTIFLHVNQVFLATPSTWWTSSAGLFVVSIFLTYKVLQGVVDVQFYPLSNFHFFGNYEFVKYQNVYLYYFATPFQ